MTRLHLFSSCAAGVAGAAVLLLVVSLTGCGEGGVPTPALSNVTTPPVTLDDAIKSGNLREVQSRLQRGGRIDPRSKETLAALNLAIEQSQLDMVRWFLKEGVDANHVDDDGTPLLFRAATKSTGAVVEELLLRGATLSTRDRLGQTALHVAVGASRREVVELLLLQGADPKAIDRSGLTALHAGLAADVAILELLIVAGADVNNTDVRGSTPLHRAAAMGNAKVIDWLISKGAKVNAKNTSGFTPLALARAEVRERLKKQGGKE